MDKDYVQFRLVGSLTDSVDDMYAALGLFTLRVLVEGEVKFKAGKRCIEIAKVGIYVKDSYDFKGAQSLGYWNDKTNYAGRNPLRGDKVTNADFRAHGGGADYKVFSDIKVTNLTPFYRFFP